MSIIEGAVKGFIKGVLEFFSGKAEEQSTIEEGEPINEREKSLRKKIKKDTHLFIVLAVSLSIMGCATRTVLVPEGKAVQLRKSIKNANIWVYDKNGTRVPGSMDLPEGWYCLPYSVDTEDYCSSGDCK